MRVGPKFDAFLDHRAEAEFLEGVTAAGKTTVGTYKFMLEVAESDKTQHILAGLDTGVIEKNIINKEHGILDEWGPLVEYRGNGAGGERLPHIVFHTRRGDRIIYVLGYDNSRRWKKALGGQYGCLYIDEINIADIDFVREAVMRCDYLIATLNPDDPSLPVYGEYVNHARELPEWTADTPPAILRELSLEEKPGWTHWFFGFRDNIALTPEKIEAIRRNVPPGTKLWKNKIEGLRGRATGLVFPNFDRSVHVLTAAEALRFRRDPEGGDQGERFRWYSCGVDTAYSQRSPDTIAMAFLGITDRGRCVVLDERVYDNAALRTPLAPSDTVRNLSDFLDRNRREWGFCRSAFIDAADQATITEAAKYKRLHGSPYSFVSAWKRERIIDRVNHQLGWLSPAEGGPWFFVTERCPVYIRELETYSWREDEDNAPEDGNDHMINAVQYAWLPYENKIGTERRETWAG